MQTLKCIYIIACGSAYHVGIVTQYVIEEMTDIEVEIDVASELLLIPEKIETILSNKEHV